MPFRLFTRRTRKPSTRLQLLARGFQVVGISGIVSMLGVLVIREYFLDHAHTPRWLFSPNVPYITLAAVSSFLIGRGLIRRQRWSAYLAGLTVATPIIRQLLNPDVPILSVGQIAIGTLALCSIVTVWDELGGARDADFDDEASHNDATQADDELLPNDAPYSAPLLLNEPIPTTTSTVAKIPLPINNQRAN